MIIQEKELTLTTGLNFVLICCTMCNVAVSVHAVTKSTFFEVVNNMF